MRTLFKNLLLISTTTLMINSVYAEISETTIVAFRHGEKLANGQM